MTDPKTYLLGDIGGTNARFAILDQNDEITDEKIYKCRDYEHISDALTAYFNEVNKPDAAVLAVAAPPNDNHVEFVNSRWSFGVDATCAEFEFSDITILNDFTAVALSIPYLKENGFLEQIGTGTPVPDGNYSVIGAGTGLGVSNIAQIDGKKKVITRDAGGHFTMAARTRRQFDVIALFKESHGHVSAERLLSGEGLLNIYKALCQIDGIDPDPNFDHPRDISENGMTGACPKAQEALNMFCDFMGTAASTVGILNESHGGVYIAGGVIDKIGEYFDHSIFRESFVTQGRYSEYMTDNMPTLRNTHGLPAFLGLREYARNSKDYVL